MGGVELKYGITWYEFFDFYFKNANRFTLKETEIAFKYGETDKTYTINGKGCLGYVNFYAGDASKGILDFEIDGVAVNIFTQTSGYGNYTIYPYIGGSGGYNFKGKTTVNTTEIYYGNSEMIQPNPPAKGAYFPFVFNNSLKIRIRKQNVSYASVRLDMNYIIMS